MFDRRLLFDRGKLDKMLGRSSIGSNKRNNQKQSNEPKISRNQQINRDVRKARHQREKGYERGRQRAEELFNRPKIGLSPEERSAIQFEANRGIKRSEQAANRRLLGEQGMHGISGKSGVAYAQQRDIARQANEARGQAQRDLSKLDEDRKLKNLAAMFSIEQGEAAQSQLDRQIAQDQLRLDDERKRQRYWENKFNRNLSRV